jgi:hypothetical protein
MLMISAGAFSCLTEPMHGALRARQSGDSESSALGMVPRTQNARKERKRYGS